VNTSLNNFNTLSNTLNTKSNQLGDELIKTTKETNVAIGEMKKLLTQYRNVMEPDSPVYDGLLEAINNFNEASQSITEFTNYLNRHPESLIRGRKGE
jgi:paraquat-inducible protein B